MDKQQRIISTLTAQGMLPLFFNKEESVSISIVKSLYEAGIRIIEYTNRGEAALENFKAIKKTALNEMPDLLVGVGTIKNSNEASSFINAGADFLISPALADDVYETAIAENILWIPGCMTPTEILKAEKWGINLVKLFPGNVLGVDFLKAVKELFPAMQFMPTGGVDATKENISEWFAAGVTAVGMGSKLITKEFIAEKNYESISVITKSVLEIIKSVKQKN
jgi:2-dehydro-3-deoxyphosphogluconate aldolase / (4S)-4-hydroxy-2-oxoglutarate aldolase